MAGIMPPFADRRRGVAAMSMRRSLCLVLPLRAFSLSIPATGALEAYRAALTVHPLETKVATAAVAAPAAVDLHGRTSRVRVRIPRPAMQSPAKVGKEV